jgi:hypothetical protein
MQRTYITSADGTLFESISYRRRVFRLALAGIATLIFAFFATAGAIGLKQAADQGAPSPAASSITLPKPLPAALNACRTVPTRFQGYCVGLYLRPAYTIGRVHTPAGPALVKECIDQYRGGELAYCLTQPIN